MRPRFTLLALVMGMALLLPGVVQAAYEIYFSPLAMTTGDSRLTVTPAVPPSAVRVTTTAPGDLQWVDLGLVLPDNIEIEGVSLCWELSSSNSYISQVRLTRMIMPGGATVIHDDGTDLTDTGPACYLSPVSMLPVEGTITLSFRLNFANAGDWVEFGAISIRVSEIVSGVDGSSPIDQPVGLSLEQNRPNPFNPSTLITYRLDEAGPVDLTVFDVSGRQVRALYRGAEAAGEHSMVWDGRNDQGVEMASGTYYYAVRSGQRADTRGMILLR